MNFLKEVKILAFTLCGTSIACAKRPQLGLPLLVEQMDQWSLLKWLQKRTIHNFQKTPAKYQKQFHIQRKMLWLKMYS